MKLYCVVEGHISGLQVLQPEEFVQFLEINFCFITFPLRNRLCVTHALSHETIGEAPIFCQDASKKCELNGVTFKVAF